MKRKGRLTRWNDAKGFGFVTPMQDGDRAFIHINAFANRARRPAVGDGISYSIGKDAQGRPCAENATIAGVPAARRRQSRFGVAAFAVGLGFLVLVSAATLAGTVPHAVLLLYLVASAVTFLVYAIDKAAAERGRWRTPESTLHMLALAGGWPGAVIAQSRLHHKTRKQPFRAVFWCTVVLNGTALAWLTTADGAAAWRALLAAAAGG